VSTTPPPPPYDDDPRYDDGRGRTTGWMLATIAIVALLVGIGAGLLIDSGGDGTTHTVRIRSTVTAAGTTPEAVTVTQPPRETTVIRTQTATVTVTVPTTATGDTQP
jgi:alpha-D-ribose 1-methylphosphonate 5-phosphate C-P lyase